MVLGDDGSRRDPEWLTLGQAARFVGVAQSTMRKWSDQGRVPAFYTPGGHRRYRRADLESFLDRSGGPAGRTREGPVVLIVDDDAQVREVVRVALVLEGYSVREAAGAEEGMAAVEQGRPDLILLDVRMPQVDGWEMLRRLQEQHGAGAIPVVMFSGHLDDAERRAATAARRTRVRREAVRAPAAGRAGQADRPGRLNALDRHLERWVIQHRWHPLDGPFIVLTKIGTAGAIWLALALVLAVAWRRPLLFVAVGLADVVADLSAYGLKVATGVERPADRDPSVALTAVPHDGSFPSGHTATSFACATVLSFVAPRFAPAVFVLALAIGYSRIYVGAHWVFDVLGGAVLGVTVGLLAARSLRRYAGARPRSGRSPRSG